MRKLKSMLLLFALGLGAVPTSAVPAKPAAKTEIRSETPPGSGQVARHRPQEHWAVWRHGTYPIACAQTLGTDVLSRGERTNDTLSKPIERGRLFGMISRHARLDQPLDCPPANRGPS